MRESYEEWADRMRRGGVSLGDPKPFRFLAPVLAVALSVGGLAYVAIRVHEGGTSWSSLFGTLVALGSLLLVGLLMCWIPSASAEGVTRQLGVGLVTGAVIALGVFLLDGHRQEQENARALRLSLSLQSDLRGIDLRGKDLSGYYLAGKDLRDAKLTGANLQNAILARTQLSNADLSGSNLRGANLVGADLSLARLGAALLVGANLTGARLEEATLAGADLRRSSMRTANLSNAFAEGANFEHADLRRAVIDDARLGGARFNDASLQQAQLVGAELTTTIGGRVLRADLSGANLSLAAITPAQLNGAIRSPATIGP